MFDIMYSRYILTIAALIVVLMMDVIYFAKANKNDKLKHRLYSYFIIINTVVLVVEIIIMIIFGLNVSFKICTIVLKIIDLLMIQHLI